jgi:hypothetical protein
VSNGVNRTGGVTVPDDGDLGLEGGPAAVGQHDLLADPDAPNDGSMVPFCAIENA